MKIHHIVCGDDNWAPTVEELTCVVDEFRFATEDHISAIVATRPGITVHSFEVEPDDVFEASPAVPVVRDLVPIGLWRHRKSGNIYKVLMVTNTAATKPGYEPTVVYTSEPDELERSGHDIWSRPVSEWHASFVKHDGPFPDRA